MYLCCNYASCFYSVGCFSFCHLINYKSLKKHVFGAGLTGIPCSRNKHGMFKKRVTCRAQFWGTCHLYVVIRQRDQCPLAFQALHQEELCARSLHLLGLQALVPSAEPKPPPHQLTKRAGWGGERSLTPEMGELRARLTICPGLFWLPASMDLWKAMMIALRKALGSHFHAHERCCW